MDLLIPSSGLLVWTLLVFLIVLFILKKFAWKPILKGLNDREQSIAASLDTAEKLKVEMAQMKSENETLMTKAREERAVMLKEAKETKDKMISEAREDAKAAAAKIIADAQAIINQQKNAALIDLKNQIGTLVVEVSEKVIRRELADKAGQENYIRQLASEVKLN
jgi:F-type H+-transporting ATPase subunit b